MCCRYYVVSDDAEIKRIYDSVKGGAEQLRFGDIYPSDFAPILIQKSSPIAARWGFRLSGGGKLVINARAETAAKRVLWRDSFFRRRCLVPASGFYEWDGQKRRHVFKARDGGPLYLCGVYREHDGVEFALLTAPSVPPVRAVHGRAPLLADREQGKRFLVNADYAAELMERDALPLAASG